jgi:hypothetical protein
VYGGTSEMTRECQVRICERLGVKLPDRLGKDHVPRRAIDGELAPTVDFAAAVSDRSPQPPSIVAAGPTPPVAPPPAITEVVFWQSILRRGFGAVR